MLQQFKFSGATPIGTLGRFFQYESVQAGASDDGITVKAGGQNLGTYYPGDSFTLPEAVSGWEIAPVTNAVGQVRIGTAHVVTTRVQLAGQVNSTVVVQKNTQVAPTHTPETVTSASTQMLAANAARQYLLIQNNHATASIWVAFGVAATTVNGIRIGPGGYWEWDSSIPTSVVNAIGDIPSNTAVVAVEG